MALYGWMTKRIFDHGRVEYLREISRKRTISWNCFSLSSYIHTIRGPYGVFRPKNKGEKSRDTVPWRYTIRLDLGCDKSAKSTNIQCILQYICVLPFCGAGSFSVAAPGSWSGTPTPAPDPAATQNFSNKSYWNLVPKILKVHLRF